MATRRGRV